MNLNFDTETPLFLQIAEQIEDGIFTGVYLEQEQIPSTTEISVRFQINPATVLKGMNVLVEQQLVYKKRGVGLFVKEGARDAIVQKRSQAFFENYIATLVGEAKKLGLNEQEVIQMIERGFSHVQD